MSATCRIEFRLEDFAAANWLHFRRYRLLRDAIAIFVTVWAGLLVLSSIIAMQYGQAITTAVAKNLLLCITGALGSVAGWILCVSISLHRSARIAFSRMKADGLVTDYSFDEESFAARNRWGDTTLEWALLTGWTENGRLLLVLRLSMIWVFPKDQVNPETLDRLRSALIAAKVPSR